MDDQTTQQILLPSQGQAQPHQLPGPSQAAQTALAVHTAQIRRGALAYLVEAGELLAGCLDPERTLALAAQLVVPKLAVWCAIHRRDETGRIRLALVWHADEEQHDALTATIGEAACAPELLTPDHFAKHEGLSPGELLAVPLEARGRVLGTMTLATTAGTPFSPDAVELARDLARRVGLAYDSAIVYAERREIAHALQASLLPAELPAVPHAEIAVTYHPAGSNAAPADLRQDDLVGGDFYDVFEIRPPNQTGAGEGCWGLAIGDVCGTGPQAAAVTGLARHALRLLAREGLRPSAVLDRLNRAILDEGDRGRFLTLCYAEVEPLPNGSLNLALICAGHPSPLILRRDGLIEAAASNQPLLGVLSEGLDFYDDSVLLSPGDTFLAFTDGASERRRGNQMLDPEGLMDVLRTCHGLSAAGVAARVTRAVEEFGDAPLSDDMAILVLRATGTAASPLSASVVPAA